MMAKRPAMVTIEVVGLCNPETRIYVPIEFRTSAPGNTSIETMRHYRFVSGENPYCRKYRNLRLTRFRNGDGVKGFQVDWYDENDVAWPWLIFRRTDGKKKLKNAFFTSAEYIRERTKESRKGLIVRRESKSCNMGFLCEFWRKESELLITATHLEIP